MRAPNAQQEEASALEEAFQGTQAIAEEFQALSASYEALMAQIDDGTVKLQDPPASSLSSLMESNEDHVVELVDAIATLEAALAEREKELSEVIVSEEEAGRKLETIETEVSTLRTRLQQVMVDRFDARLLLTQNDAQSLREHASLDGTGVVVSSVEQEDLDLSSEENILNAERYRSLPGTRWFIDDEKSDDEQPAPTQGIASPPTDANGEDVTDEWAHVASTTPPSWLWFDVDAQTTPRVPQHIQTHAAICAAACV